MEGRCSLWTPYSRLWMTGFAQINQGVKINFNGEKILIRLNPKRLNQNFSNS